MKPVINLRAGYNNQELLQHAGRKVRVSYKDSLGRKRIKLLKIKVSFNCECCGCHVVAVDKNGKEVESASGGYIPGV
jgi:hypothetical protein